jgi:hypothetical protein
MHGIHLNCSILLFADDPILVSCTEDHFHTVVYKLHIRNDQHRVGISTTKTRVIHLEEMIPQ